MTILPKCLAMARCTVERPAYLVGIHLIAGFARNPLLQQRSRDPVAPGETLNSGTELDDLARAIRDRHYRKLKLLWVEPPGDQHIAIIE